MCIRDSPKTPKPLHIELTHLVRHNSFIHISMGCGTASNDIIPPELGRGKCNRSWKIANHTARNVITLDLNEAEEEGITEIANPEGAFSVHCTCSCLLYTSPGPRD
eukprot:TRINITY_DN8635_c0_g1_i3.p1 TRINITY_DN8635_c0_g1~~TRINITY_DN8635_c0_g1_i3.p1  ORF type:complete len:106 (+),score=17.76 TRINITY_DN8635_c0_g1_i3:67-384(+)